MKTHSENVIENLIITTRQNLNFTEFLKQKNDTELNWKENPESWSVLECLEHLNRYGHFYIPAIEKTILNSKYNSEVEFKSGILGNFFAESMLPKKKLNKMKTFKDKNPLNSNLDRKVIDEFIHQQIQTIALLNKAKTVSLSKNKVEITLTKWMKLKLGDTFRFVINHNCRHIQQIQNNLDKQTANR
ncbi:MAG: DinB family protein [Flavobacterium sp.]|nr:DinB family protein [Flavobacterium sp.]